jgi:hypothetical protein
VGFTGRAGRVWPRPHRNERGGTLVEAAIIVPLLMLMVFGGIELGIGFGQKGGLESVARAGARRAATETDVDDAITHTQIGLDTADAVNAALGTTSLPKMNSLYVYRIEGATGVSSGPSGWNQPCQNSSSCIRFTYDNGAKKFVYDSGSWPAGVSTRDACSVQADRVGVTLNGQFAFLTGLIGSGFINLTATSVLQLEPTNC